MGKYIIETDGTIEDNIQGYLGFPIEICGKRTWVKTDIKLTPYTELDLEQVRKEAFEKGYSTAVAEQECAVKGAAEKGYQKGLSDAWEAARKIALPPEDGGIGVDKVDEIFHVAYYCDALKYCSASEAIEKIRQYEQDRQTKIKYDFDEIKDVLNTTMKKCNVSLDDIVKVLQKMKESES